MARWTVAPGRAAARSPIRPAWSTPLGRPDDGRGGLCPAGTARFSGGNSASGPAAHGVGRSFFRLPAGRSPGAGPPPARQFDQVTNTVGAGFKPAPTRVAALIDRHRRSAGGCGRRPIARAARAAGSSVGIRRFVRRDFPPDMGSIDRFSLSRRTGRSRRREADRSGGGAPVLVRRCGQGGADP